MNPLQGVRIVSVEQFGAAPYGTMLLADLGAEVIKIENAAIGGDPARKTGPYFLGENDSEYYQAFNINKKSVAIDLRSAEGKAALAALIATADALVNSAMTLSVIAGLGVADISENGFALGWDYIKLPNPVFAGDTLYSESEVVSRRESKSRPDQGIIKVRTRGINQDGKIVIEYERSVMVWKKGHAPLKALFPEVKYE